MAALIKSPTFKEGGVDLVPRASVNVAGAGMSPPAVRQSPLRQPVPEVAAPQQTPRQQSGESAGIPKSEPPQPAPQSPEHTAEPVSRPTPAIDPAIAARERAALLEEARQQAAREGFEKGLNEGHEAARSDQQESLAAWSALLASGRAEIAELLVEAETLIAAVVFESVCKIVGRQLPSAEGCAAVVREVLARVGREEVVSVRVSPADHAMLEATAGSGIDIEGVLIEPDEGIELGGCVLSLKAGSIDGRIETQFRQFAQSLKDAARKS